MVTTRPVFSTKHHHRSGEQLCMSGLKVRQAGFHLLDVLIGVLLLALIMSVSIPSVSGALTSQTLRTESNYLKILITRLIIQARQREKDLVLTLRKTAYTAKEKGSTGKIIENHTLKGGVYLDLGRVRSKSLHFYSAGANQPASIVMRHKDGTCEITVSLRGQVRCTC